MFKWLTRLLRLIYRMLTQFISVMATSLVIAALPHGVFAIFGAGKEGLLFSVVLFPAYFISFAERSNNINLRQSLRMQLGALIRAFQVWLILLLVITGIFISIPFIGTKDTAVACSIVVTAVLLFQYAKGRIRVWSPSWTADRHGLHPEEGSIPNPTEWDRSCEEDTLEEPEEDEEEYDYYYILDELDEEEEEE